MRILLTGAAGFIGSCMIKSLNDEGIYDIWICDDFLKKEKEPNYSQKKFSQKIERNALFNFLEQSKSSPDWIIHIGARTDTTEFNDSVFDSLNVEYSKKLWEYATQRQIPFIYASSAATYGLGEHGYSDDENKIHLLRPLNPYGWSKQKFDLWALEQRNTPPHWYGFKFFNVYGPNEYHKGRMASVVFHGFNQVKEKGTIRLFRSHKEGIPDGHQKRDFIYVKDIISVILYFMKHQPGSGIYNLGSGTARTFLDLATAVFNAMNVLPKIEWIDTPEDIRSTYQYYTCADIQKLRTKGKYDKPFYTLEEGIEDYVKNYLIPHVFL
ncbi:MAG: ADP-glyceromanno-heptose 6-epimerase [Bacteroidia bacterium]|nr:ADP-glyceromanno-heptose 6-epimerase [Bacteroidia bacterium]